ncbi:MAG: hypothetical protein JST12_07080 [Armatimonadetes bacterium]|nr:hypothetical protein [Armatimonadota bacterium]
MKTLAPSTTRVLPPRRTAPFNEEPGYYEPADLWLYGNTRLLSSDLVTIESLFGMDSESELTLNEIEREAENFVLHGKTLVTGINHTRYQRAAVVPLRWGAPRVLVVRGGFYTHLGPDLTQEPFLMARLWRYEFDPGSDLIVSRQNPNAPKTTRTYLTSIDRLVRQIVEREVPGLLFN